jgi:DNA-binding protein HU-beta
MNKGDLVNEVAEVLCTKKEAESAVACIFESITTALKEKESVSVVGFGTFKVNKRKGREGRNPKTGEAVHIPERYVPKFVPAKTLKEAVN